MSAILLGSVYKALITNQFCGESAVCRCQFHISQIFIPALLTLPAAVQCSVSCGKGKRERYVSCRDAHGGVADESHCAHLPRPPESSACFSPCGKWHAGEWSPVSKKHARCVQSIQMFSALGTPLNRSLMFTFSTSSP